MDAATARRINLRIGRSQRQQVVARCRFGAKNAHHRAPYRIISSPDLPALRCGGVDPRRPGTDRVAGIRADGRGARRMLALDLRTSHPFRFRSSGVGCRCLADSRSDDRARLSSPFRDRAASRRLSHHAGDLGVPAAVCLLSRSFRHRLRRLRPAGHTADATPPASCTRDRRPGADRVSGERRPGAFDGRDRLRRGCRLCAGASRAPARPICRHPGCLHPRASLCPVAWRATPRPCR